MIKFDINRKSWTRRASYYRAFVRPVIESTFHQLSLRCVQNNTRNIKNGSFLLFSCVRNEAPRIPFFLDYYRRLGVDHFLFVDNDSRDNFLDLLIGHDDISVWHTKASFKRSKFAMGWLNALLRRYGTGHWCLTVDSDELLVYPFYETRNLTELTSWLDSHHRESMFCLLLDMYGDRSVHETRCPVRQNPLSVAPYFDGVGYVQNFETWRGEPFIQGGPRRRVYFRDIPSKAPALNKVPLVKWRSSFSYLSTTHFLSHMRLNRAHGKEGLYPTGCLLHFKFLSQFAEKAREEIERKQHYDDASEYVRYKRGLDAGEDRLLCETSVKFENSAQLIELGLMHRAEWF
jgi:hypothetical protein